MRSSWRFLPSSMGNAGMEGKNRNAARVFNLLGWCEARDYTLTQRADKLIWGTVENDIRTRASSKRVVAGGELRTNLWSNHPPRALRNCSWLGVRENRLHWRSWFLASTQNC